MMNGTKKLILTLFTLGVIPWEDKEYYDNGKLKSKFTYRGLWLNGPYKKYYENGKLKEKGNYLFDKKDGPCKKYNKYGIPVEECNYRSGERDGPYKEVYYGVLRGNDQCEVREIGTYESGVKQGTFYTDGFTFPYGKERLWGDDVLSYPERFRKWTGKGFYKNGKLHGRYKEHYCNEKSEYYGSLHYSCYCEDGKVIGEPFINSHELINCSSYLAELTRRRTIYSHPPIGLRLHQKD